MNTACSDDGSPNAAHKCALPMFAKPRFFDEKINNISEYLYSRQFTKSTGKKQGFFILKRRFKMKLAEAYISQLSNLLYDN